MEVNLIEKRLATPNEYERYGIATLSHQLNTAKEALEAKWQRFEELDKKMSDWLDFIFAFVLFGVASFEDLLTLGFLVWILCGFTLAYLSGLIYFSW